MGKKLGNALIIYGVLNFLVVLFIPGVMNGAVFGAFIWMVILILLGNWQRGKARSQKAMDRQTELLESIDEKQERDALADTINRILDEREGRAKAKTK